MKGYQSIIGEKIGMEVSTFAVGGMTLQGGLLGYINNGTIDSQITRADLITILMGTNDYGPSDGVDVGQVVNITSDSFDTSTFVGAYQQVIKKIFTLNPHVTLILLTPLQRVSGEVQNGKNATLRDYVKGVCDVGKYASCKVINLYEELGINCYNTSTFTLDGLHPNQKGFDLLGEYLSNIIRNY